MNEIALSSSLLDIEEFNSDKEIEIFISFLNGSYEYGYKDKMFYSIFNSFFGIKPPPTFKDTKHEKAFSLLYPYLEKQVAFGTGKGGYKEWGVKKFTVDFYNKKTNTIYEIDGASHFTEIGRLKDEYRDGLLHLLHGVNTVRISNKEVEMMLLERIRKVGVENFEINQ